MLNSSYISQISGFFSDKPVKRSYLFGSYARNEESEHSDIDILVEVDYSKNKVSLLDFIGWKLELEKITNHAVDLVAADGISKYIKLIIEKEKILIYERHS
ncbi:MAG: nucleotidyltransferase [Bacteroidetes bacterium]|nr:nucleotidyltransferase [Bacteroidota bacterium]